MQCMVIDTLLENVMEENSLLLWKSKVLLWTKCWIKYHNMNVISLNSLVIYIRWGNSDKVDYTLRLVGFLFFLIIFFFCLYPHSSTLSNSKRIKNVINDLCKNSWHFYCPIRMNKEQNEKRKSTWILFVNEKGKFQWKSYLKSISTKIIYLKRKAKSILEHL